MSDDVKVAGTETTETIVEMEADNSEVKSAEELVAMVVAKEQELSELDNRYKRLQADFDNFRRRTKLEKAELAQVVTESVTLQLLPVIDNLERALTTGETQDAASVINGVELIYRQLMNTLEKLEIKPIAAVGEQFDPNRHEAVMSVADEGAADGTVLEEFQRGYTLGVKTIRPSMVKVVVNS